MKTIRVGNGAGFWGDWNAAPRNLVHRGQLDVLTLEYLAELTLSVLAHKRKKSQPAYVADIAETITSLGSALRDQPQLQVITNAGGLDPRGCAAAVSQALLRAGLTDLRIASVSGDDLMDRVPELIRSGALRHMESGDPLPADREVVCANAYLGAASIQAALGTDARIVLTGRVTDAALCLGPAMHAFRWSPEDWNRLAGGVVAGHLIECGAQVTGGMYSGWEDTIDLANVGYPIAEVVEDGTAVITKPPGTGGCVTAETVSEQLVYEIGDPRHYLTPDVDADFSHVTCMDDGTDRVAVAGAVGAAPPDTYKVSVAYADGFRGTGSLIVCGRHAERKARRTAEIALDRAKQDGAEFVETRIDVFGGGSGDGNRYVDALVQVSVRSPDREHVVQLLRNLPSLVANGPPGVTGYNGPRPGAWPVMTFWPGLVAKEHVEPLVETRTAAEWAGERASDRPGGTRGTEATT